MSKKRGFRLITMLTVCILLVGSFSMTAFAYADDTDQNLPVTEATQPEETPQPEPTASIEKPSDGEPIDDEGNAYTRDLLYDKATNKQFITVQTKNGNTFYIVIDYDAPINEEEEQYKTYFLNVVDDRDLFALLDDEDANELKTCICDDKCVVGDVNTDCPVCKTNLSECAGKEKVREPEPEPEQPKKKSGSGLLAVVALLALAGGGAFAYVKFIKPNRSSVKVSADPDEYDFPDEEYINEDEPAEAETEAEHE